jgi:hypothetical protein
MQPEIPKNANGPTTLRDHATTSAATMQNAAAM